jgi:hypothetical protein
MSSAVTGVSLVSQPPRNRKGTEFAQGQICLVLITTVEFHREGDPSRAVL